MLDIRLIVERKEEVEANLRKRDPSISLDGVASLAERQRELRHAYDESRHSINSANDYMRSADKKSAAFADKVGELRALKGQSQGIKAQLDEIETRLREEMLALPNMIADGVPVSGRKEDKDIVYVFGEKPQFDFTPKDHVVLAKEHGLIDFDRGTRMAESGFPLYTGKGATLEWALINYFIDHARDKGFDFQLFPLLNNTASLTASGNLPKFAEEIYSCERDPLHLIPTAEVPITNLYSGETIPEERLPVRIVSYSPCFRREAGSYGKMARGLMRLHQFNKVETYSFCTPEQAKAEHELLIENGQEILRELGLHFRLANLPSCDLAQQSSQTFDIEIWLPHLGDYSEVSSASNCRDYQARRANIAYKGAEGRGFVHTLNCSALATPRVMIALLESNQTADGRIRVPEPLQRYTRFSEI